jgi:hypothetical protein
MEGAFKDDTSGGNVICLCPVPPVITDATFNDKMFENKGIQLRVPEGTEELYRNAPGWRRFPNIIGNQPYTPLPDQGREYHMKLHRSGEGMENITVPISEVADVHLDDNDSKVVVRLNGKEDLTTDILRVDSITWQPGFVYENAEIFNLNDSTLTAYAQKCTVKFDATVIDDDVQLCVRNLVLSPKPTENALHGFAVDLSLSDGTHELSGTAEITVPVEPSPEGKVCAAYYNEEEGCWEPVCFKYDKDKGTVTILTDHLSAYSFFWELHEHTHDAHLRFYDELPQVYDFKEAVNVLLELVKSENITKEMVFKFKDDMAFWQSIGLDVVYNCFNSVANSYGFTFETLDNVSQAMGYLGLAVSILDVARAEIEGDDVGVAAGSLNTILSYTLGQAASAIGTPIMSASMACVAFIGIALNNFGTMVQARKVELYREAYRLYYSKQGKKEFGSPYRSAKDWYQLFYPEFLKGKMTEKELNNYLKETVCDYCDLFWRDVTGTAEMCIEKAKAMGLSSDMYPDEALMKQISEDHFAELMNGELVSVVRAIKNHVQVEANKRCAKAAGDVADIVNLQIGLQFYDSSWKEGEISKYSGWKVRFTEIPSSITDKEEWERTISDRGKAALGFFTLYALMENDIKCNVTLYDENGVEQKTFEFKVPEGTGKRVVNIDLEKDGIEVEYPKLQDLQLIYDPFEVWGIVTFSGTISGTQQDVNYEWESENETVIFMDGTLLKNTRFQKELERFFKFHDFITVDEFGNFKLGDDISGKFEGDQATGTFSINTTNPFTESTVEQIVDLVNSGGSLSLSYRHLLNGTLQHKIVCQFTITRNSESKEYTVNYTGSGDYTLNHEVVSRVEHIDFDNFPNGNLSITTDDIFTQQKEANGTVKLQYTTKLK